MISRAFVLSMVVFAILSASDSMVAHHSFAPVFDGEKVVHLKGVVRRFEWINPHTFIIVDVTSPDGKTEQWALEGPSVNGLVQRGYTPVSIKAGEIVEACGYGARVAAPKFDSKSGVSRRIMNVELLTLTEGGTRVWQDYGQRKCRDAQ
jgi:hypothetical protein